MPDDDLAAPDRARRGRSRGPLGACAGRGAARSADINWLPRERHFVLGDEPLRLGERAERRLAQARLPAPPLGAAFRARRKRAVGRHRPRRPTRRCSSSSPSASSRAMRPPATWCSTSPAARRSASSVEVLEAQLTDLGPAWSTPLAPRHVLGLSRDGDPPRHGRADFEARFAALLAAKREVAEDVEAAVRAIIDDVRAARRRGAHRLHRSNSIGIDADAPSGCESPPTRSPRPSGRVAPEAARGARASRATASRRTTAASCRRTTATPMRSASSSARAGRRSRRSASTCRAARRLSLLGADERRAGEGRRRRARRHGRRRRPDGELNPLVLAAARLAGVDEIYRIGGAQAVAALAYGTATHRAGRQDRRARATPTSPRPSGRSSARSAST